MTDVLPLAAGSWGVLMGLAPVFQIRRIIQRRSSADVSLGYLAVLLVGFVLWLSYGLSIGDPAIVVTNVASLSACVATIAAVVVFRTARQPRGLEKVSGPSGMTGLSARRSGDR